MGTKYSPAPWRVVQDEKWPFRIEIVDANGETISSEMRYAYSSDHETLDDVMNARGLRWKGDPEFADKCVDANARQLSNAHLRAAAPDLLDALINLLKVHEGEGGTRYHAGDIARAAISKALGD